MGDESGRMHKGEGVVEERRKETGHRKKRTKGSWWDGGEKMVRTALALNFFSVV
jgi:hypothetical protein